MKGPSVGISERGKEIKRRRKRKKQYAHLKSKLDKATVSEKVEIARKLRGMTPGADVLIGQWGLDESDR